MTGKVRKPLTVKAAQLKMSGLCARKEMCEFEVRDKLLRAGLPADDAELVIDYLVENRFVDNARYARAFASDKLRFAGWGRNKIRMALVAKRIPAMLIREALESLEHSIYAGSLLKVARSKAAGLDLEQYDDRAKLYRRLLSRGYEPALVASAIETLRAGRDEEA